MTRTVAYIAHKLSAPTREEMLSNACAAAEWGTWLARHFMIAPVADWIWMSQVLEETADNLALGLACDFEIVARCDVLIHVGTKISEGMRLEAERAKRVIDLTALEYAIPVDDHWCHGSVAEILTMNGIRRYQPGAS